MITENQSINHEFFVITFLCLYWFYCQLLVLGVTSSSSSTANSYSRLMFYSWAINYQITHLAYVRKRVALLW